MKEYEEHGVAWQDAGPAPAMDKTSATVVAIYLAVRATAGLPVRTSEISSVVLRVTGKTVDRRTAIRAMREVDSFVEVCNATPYEEGRQAVTEETIADHFAKLAVIEGAPAWAVVNFDETGHQT